jgi:acetoin utilization deacetylase AcuC-like enzyme
MLLISSSRFVDHLTPPGHPESPERAEIFDGVAERAQLRGVEVIEPAPASDEALLRIHTRPYLDAISATSGRVSMIDPDTFTSPETVTLARLAAGAAILAVDRCLASAHAAPAGARPHGAWPQIGTESVPRALALVRPPGHHAEADRAMGFCFFNNIAIAAAHARARGVERVAIVDFDVHHGNGTQRSFYADPNVLFISTHQYPFYPGTGAATEVGSGAGTGCTVNVPIEGGATDGDYQRVFEAIVTPVLYEFRPDLVLVSAGFDAHERDPLAQMRVTTPGFVWMTTMLRDLADGLCGGRLAVITEGGYDLRALAESLDAVCGVLEATTSAVAHEPLRGPTPRADRAIAAVREAQAAKWAGL